MSLDSYGKEKNAKVPIVPKLQLDQLNTQASTDKNYDEDTNEQNQNQYETLISTWRSIDSCLQSCRENPSQLQSQLQDLQAQIQILMQSQQYQAQTNEVLEQEAKNKVNELFDKLQDQNLKISEQNKSILEDALLNKTLHNKTQEFAPNNSLAFINTLTQVLQEQRCDDIKFETQLKEQQEEIETLKLEKEVLIQSKDEMKQQYESEIQKLKDKEQELHQEITQLKTNLSQQIKSTELDQNLNTSYQSQNTNNYKRSFNSQQVFKQSVRRYSISHLNQISNNGLEEPTPRFLIDKQQNNTEDLGNTLFRNNLNLNRSQFGQTQNQFNSTMNSMFKRRPQFESNQKQDDQLKELWIYVFDLEQEVMDLQQKQKRQKDESQLEVSVCMGANDAIKNIKTSLETQIEQLAEENQEKTQRIVQLESYTLKLHQNVQDFSKEDEPSFMRNLKGILSPTHYKNIQQFMQDEGNKTMNQRDGCSKYEQNNIDEKQNEILDVNQSLDLSIMPSQQNVFYEHSFSKDQFSETRIMHKDSKNSTLSFKHLNIDTSQENQAPETLLSPIYQVQAPLTKTSKNKKFMLIQDQNISQEQENIYQTSLYQPSQIMNSSVDQSQFLNTQNNKTLQNLFKGNQQTTNTEQSNGQKRPLFGFKRKQNQSNTMSQEKSFQGAQTGLLFQQLQDNFNQQIQDMKEEKLKLVQVLNKFLMLPEDSSFQQIEQSLSNTSNKESTSMPSKQYFEDFRLQITQALSNQQKEYQQIQQERDQFLNQQQQFKQEKERLEQKRIEFNNKVEKLKSKTNELNKKLKLIDEREQLTDQHEQKLKYRKQAMDEEWKRLDKKKQEINRQEDQIQKEWDTLNKELQDMNQMRQEVKEKKFKVKQDSVKVKEQQKLLEQKEQQLNEDQQQIDNKEKEVSRRERQITKEKQRLEQMRSEMNNDREEIEKQKQFIQGERSLIDNEKSELEQKRSLNGMFIPDIKRLVTRMQSRDKRNGNEDRIMKQYKSVQQKQSDKVNMNAYLKGCSENCSMDEKGLNCQLHKSLSKSTIQEKEDGRDNGYLSLSKAYQRGSSFLRNNNNLSGSQLQIPKSSQNVNKTVIENKENNSTILNSNLKSILKNTAKFKESQYKLEQSYNSLQIKNQLNSGEQHNKLVDTHNSFMSFEDKDDLTRNQQQQLDTSFSVEEL